MVSFSKGDGKRGNKSLLFEEIWGLKNKRMQIMSLTLAVVPQGDSAISFSWTIFTQCSPSFPECNNTLNLVFKPGNDYKLIFV